MTHGITSDAGASNILFEKILHSVILLQLGQFL